jgi:hypothetical protein
MLFSCVLFYSVVHQSRTAEMQYIAWKDKKTIHILDSSVNPTTPLSTCQRRDVRDKSSVLDLAVPVALEHYRQNMGGVDHQAQGRALYGFDHRQHRWWMRAALLLIDVAVSNVWAVRRSMGFVEPQVEMRRILAISLLELPQSQRVPSARSRDHSLSSRVDSHFPTHLSTERRCVVCSKDGQRRESRYGCSDCVGVHLCIDPCFGVYHKRSISSSSVASTH